PARARPPGLRSRARGRGAGGGDPCRRGRAEPRGHREHPPGGGGRPRRGVRLTPRGGVPLGGAQMEAGAVRRGGGGRARRGGAAPSGVGGLRARGGGAPPGEACGATPRATAALVEGLERELGARAVVGVGMPGAISPATGRVKNANSTWLNGRPLADDLFRVL